jgi:hypothetical protein
MPVHETVCQQRSHPAVARGRARWAAPVLGALALPSLPLACGKAEAPPASVQIQTPSAAPATASPEVGVPAGAERDAAASQDAASPQDAGAPRRSPPRELLMILDAGAQLPFADIDASGLFGSIPDGTPISGLTPDDGGAKGGRRTPAPPARAKSP